MAKANNGASGLGPRDEATSESPVASVLAGYEGIRGWQEDVYRGGSFP